MNDGESEAIRVIVPRDLHIGDEAFEQVEIGETVKVQIKKSRFQINDPYILSVGMFLSSSGKGVAPNRVIAPELPVAAEGETGAEAEDEEAYDEDEDEDEEDEEATGAEEAEEAEVLAEES